MSLLGGLLAVLVGIAAIVYAARRTGRGWVMWVLAGAGGWVAAQLAKAITALLVAVAAAHGRPLSTGVAALTSSAWWYPLFVAALPAVWEELGKYLPLRWARVSTWRQALALGIGAGALEAVYVGALTAGGLLPGVGVLQVAVGLWERVWALTAHAGLATLDGAAACFRRPAWLVGAVALHLASGLVAGRYQQLRSLGAHGQVPALVATEVVAAVVAVAALGLGRRAWVTPGA